MSDPREVVAGPDGTVFFRSGARIRAVDPSSGTIRAVAGTGRPGFSGDGGPATDAAFGGGDCVRLPPRAGMAVAGDGTLYFTDSNNQRVRAVDPRSGVIRTVAGTGNRGFSGDGGPATEADLDCPNDVGVAPDGTLYVADRFNYRIRAIDPATGVIRTVAGRDESRPGSGTSRDSGGEKATETGVEADAIAVGTDGRVYFADQDDDQIRAVDVARDRIVTVSGKGGPAAGTSLRGPVDLSFGPAGKLYVLAGGGNYRREENRIVVVDVANGRLTRFAGASAPDSGAPVPPLGDGVAPDAVSLAGAGGVAAAPDGTVYFTDFLNRRLRRIGPAAPPPAAAAHSAAAQPVVTVAGSGRLLDENARRELRDEEEGTFYRDVHARDEVDLDTPRGIAVDEDGTVYVADSRNNRIRRVDPSDGEVTTVAGTAEPAFGDPEPGGATASDTSLDDPVAVALGPDRTLYFTHGTGSASRIMAVDLESGTIRTVRGGGGLDDVADLAVAPDGTLYVADKGNDRVCRIPPAGGRCDTVAGESGDDTPGEGSLPADAIALAPDGTLYAAIARRCQIVAVDTGTGAVTTIAGVPLRAGVSGDGGRATSAEIGVPSGVAVGPAGTLYFADRANHRVRAFDPRTRTVQAVAGTGRSTGRNEQALPPVEFGGGGLGGDGGPAGTARLSSPTALAIGPGGAIYVSDSGNNRIRAIGDVPTPTGVVIHPMVYVLSGLGVLILAGATVVAVRWRRRRAEASPLAEPAAR